MYPATAVQTATGLSSGMDTVTVTDAYGCFLAQAFTITQPAALTTTNSQTNVSCNGNADGAATVVTSGGTTPYTYLWSNGQTAATATGLLAGMDTVTVTDAHGCFITQAFTITQPAAIVISNQPQNSSIQTGANTLFAITAPNISSYQ